MPVARHHGQEGRPQTFAGELARLQCSFLDTIDRTGACLQVAAEGHVPLAIGQERAGGAPPPKYTVLLSNTGSPSCRSLLGK